MATGMVGRSGRAIRLVAPNSPIEMVKANTAPTNTDRATMGRSTSRHTCQGDAPRSAAASRRWGWMERSAGRTLRTTKGSATSVWARTINRGEVRRLSGGSSSATMYPSPSVTAEVPNGSIKTGSSNRLNHRPRGRGLRAEEPEPRALSVPALSSTAAAISPSTTESPTVASANPTELRTAATGGT